MGGSEVVVYRDASLLAKSVAARLVTALTDAQAARGDASLVLTGGGIGIASLRAVLESQAVEAVDWSRVDVWWGDERFVPGSDPERNEKQAREALLDHLPLDPDRVFPMAPSDGPYGDDIEAAAEAYAKQLAEHGKIGTPDGVPAFDVLLLGLGPEGHCASLFPESPALKDPRAVVAVRHSPKPPPLRLSLTLTAIGAAREVWLIAAGEEKADAVRLALSEGAGMMQIPAAGAVGTDRTLWLLDRSAASRLSASDSDPD